jgi:hypothetical protein
MQKKQVAEKSWFKQRLYPHLSDRANNRKEVEKLVENPKKVAKHSFLPLIHKKIPVRRYKILGYTATGLTKRGHKEQKNKVWKSTKKIRPIHYPTHIDAHIYAYYSNEIIQQKYEALLAKNTDLSACITAYRRVPTADGLSHKSNIHFAKEVFDYIAEVGECCALAFDIESFFSNLDHSILKAAWTKLLGTKSLPPDHYNIYKSITNFSYVLLTDLYKKGSRHFDEQKLAYNRQKGVHSFFESIQDFRNTVNSGKLKIYKTQYHNQDKTKKELRGIPQGLPISAMLANLYLLEFDKQILAKTNSLSIGLYRRYSDDIVVICSVAEKELMQQFVFDSIKKFKLEISKPKIEVCLFAYTEIQGKKQLSSTKIIEGFSKPNFPFRYLGFEFYGYKTLIKVTNLSKFYRRMKQAINSKVRRINMLKEKQLTENIALHKRKLYRIYTDKGKKARLLFSKITEYHYNQTTRLYSPITITKERKYRGNFFSYIARGSKIMSSDNIEKQVQQHWKIFHSYLDKKLKGK